MAKPALSLILDSSGRPFSKGGNGRALAMSGQTNGLDGPIGNRAPYHAANPTTQEMANWHPHIQGPDSETTPYRDRVVARSRDLVRNDGWASGGITRILDNCIGTNLRLNASPDHKFLRAKFGLTAFDAAWAREFAQVAEALYRDYSHSQGHHNDYACELTVGQMQRLAMRHELIDGDSLLVSQWCPERVGYGAASYATCFQLLDTDRLSNPFQAPDSAFMRGGVELHEDGSGRPVAVHCRKAEPNNWYLAQESVTWERIAKYEPDGWQRVIHSFSKDRTEQHRGLGIFVPILAHMKMLAQYLGVELQAATIAAQLGLFVQSPYDPKMVEDAIGGGPDDEAELMLYQGLRSEWHKEHPAMFNGVRVPTLAPGETINSVESAHPNGNFGAFSNAMLSIFASATGLSVESITQDWTRSNYSSARASLAETWKTLLRRREDFVTGVAGPMYSNWLQEAMEKGELPLPNGAPAFVEARTAYSKALFLGPPRGWIDGTKEAGAAMLRMDAGISTLRAEAAEQGKDWEEVIEQRAIEVAVFKKHGIAPPSWSNMVGPNMEVFGETDTGDASNAAAPAPK